MIVVSDTSAVLNLARINRLDILRALYGEVLIPSAVYKELTDSADDLTAAIAFVSEPWLIVAVAEDRDQVRRFRRDHHLIRSDQRRFGLSGGTGAAINVGSAYRCSLALSRSEARALKGLAVST